MICSPRVTLYTRWPRTAHPLGDTETSGCPLDFLKSCNCYSGKHKTETCIILVMFPLAIWGILRGRGGPGIGSHSSIPYGPMRSGHENTQRCQHSGRSRWVADPDATSPGKRPRFAALPNVIGMINMPMWWSELV